MERGAVGVVPGRADGERHEAAAGELQREVAVHRGTILEVARGLAGQGPRTRVIHAHLRRVEGDQHRRPRALESFRGQQQVARLHHARHDLDRHAVLCDALAVLPFRQLQARPGKEFGPRAHQRVPRGKDFRPPRGPFRRRGDRAPVVPPQRRAMLSEPARKLRRGREGRPQFHGHRAAGHGQRGGQPKAEEEG